jgi:hypothetical protein
VTKWPICAGTLKNSQPCKSVVANLKSDDELERTYCATTPERLLRLRPSWPKTPKTSKTPGRGRVPG